MNKKTLNWEKLMGWIITLCCSHKFIRCISMCFYPWSRVYTKRDAVGNIAEYLNVNTPEAQKGSLKTTHLFIYVFCYFLVVLQVLFILKSEIFILITHPSRLTINWKGNILIFCPPAEANVDYSYPDKTSLKPCRPSFSHSNYFHD